MRQVQRERGGVGQGFAAHQRAQQERGQHIPRAVKEALIALAVQKQRLVHAARQDRRARQARPCRHVRDHHVLRAEVPQAPAQPRYRRFLRRIAGVGLVQQKGRFGQVGRDGARAGAQAAHLRGQAAVQQGVQPPVIAEGRVHKEVGIPVAEEVDHLQHHLHLRPRRKISRIERVKMQAQRFDMPRDGQKLAAQVQMGIARKFARVGAQQRRGHHGGIHPRGA